MTAQRLSLTATPCVARLSAYLYMSKKTPRTDTIDVDDPFRLVRRSRLSKPYHSNWSPSTAAAILGNVSDLPILDPHLSYAGLQKEARKKSIPEQTMNLTGLAITIGKYAGSKEYKACT
ncbi:hypothetical protein BJX66DRAFT_33 [Aspergillus keveii]|uniref:Uncharacterized protein n=1 Tax=Aspergillus keveii TaxID=714993 RepID=A0ABR4GPN9_9EURO